jgi:ketosteroid isomerase-like protein
MVANKAQRLAEAMAVFSQGDVERFGEMLLADDVMWHWPGRSSVAGEYRGRADALRLLRGFRELTAERLHLEPIDILEGENHLMAFTHVTADRDDDHLDVMMADAMRFGDDGRVVEYWTLSNDQDAVDRFIG